MTFLYNFRKDCLVQTMKKELFLTVPFCIYFTATASTQLLAGYGDGKNSAYTSLIAEKSFISLINTVVFMTCSISVPAAFSRWERFSNACLACATEPSGISPVDGTTGIMPEVYTIPPVSTAWEYGPIAAGALSVLIMFFMFCTMPQVLQDLQPFSFLLFFNFFYCP